MDQFVRMLKKSILFSDLTEESIKNEILPRGLFREVPKAHYLINYQQRCDTFGIVVRGKLKIMHIYENGHYGVMGILEPSDLFGVDLISTKSRISPYYAVAMQQTQVLSFPAEMVMKRGTLPEEVRQNVIQKVLSFVADENMRKEYRLAILFQKGIRDRVMTYLTMQASKRRSATFSVPFTREEMASYLCVNRSCLSHELSTMEQEGIIKFNRNTFTLLNWGKSKEYHYGSYLCNTVV